MTQDDPRKAKARLTYRTIWRWHFYAGLFCIPFVIWLSITGGIYLFKSEIESWLDRPYDQLQGNHPRMKGADLIRVATQSVPGSVFMAYELPQSDHSSVRILVSTDEYLYRVYVHPQTGKILNSIREDQRPMRQLFYLHGELAWGDKGSMIVELAASWAVIMILSGLYLWWPRQTEKIAGVFWPRLNGSNRIFWRDLHAVTGVWVSIFALFLLFSGLPWAKSWGMYLKTVRKITNTVKGPQDWTTGRSTEVAEQKAMKQRVESASHQHHGMHGMEHVHPLPKINLSAIDRMIETVQPLGLAHPVLISPPQTANGPWTAKSDAPNRTLRAELTLDPETGAILHRVNFNQRHWIDRAVGFGVAAHEGQLFGFLNQLLGLFTVIGLILLCVSAVILWWRRRPVGVLGAPAPLPEKGLSLWIVLPLLVLVVYLPLLGLSMAVVLVTEKWLLSKIPLTRNWLGLTSHS